MLALHKYVGGHVAARSFDWVHKMCYKSAVIHLVCLLQQPEMVRQRIAIGQRFVLR